jgi:excisionase family DNA binding protein
MMMKNDESSQGDRMLTIKEVCDWLNVSRATVDRYIKKGWIVAVKYDHLVRIKRSEVERFLEEHKRK